MTLRHRLYTGKHVTAESREGKLTRIRFSCGRSFFRLVNSPLVLPWQQATAAHRRGWLFTYEHNPTYDTSIWWICFCWRTFPFPWYASERAAGFLFRGNTSADGQLQTGFSFTVKVKKVFCLSHGTSLRASRIRGTITFPSRPACVCYREAEALEEWWKKRGSWFRRSWDFSLVSRHQK